MAISHFSRTDTVTGYWLNDWGLIPGRSKTFSPIHSVESGSGPHPASYPMETEDYFSGKNWPEREADHSPPYSAEVKNEDLYLDFTLKSSKPVLN
jgi:hypothetical protein